jgi:hypothetical protein
MPAKSCDATSLLRLKPKESCTDGSAPSRLYKRYSTGACVNPDDGLHRAVRARRLGASVTAPPQTCSVSLRHSNVDSDIDTLYPNSNQLPSMLAYEHASESTKHYM